MLIHCHGKREKKRIFFLFLAKKVCHQLDPVGNGSILYTPLLNGDILPGASAELNCSDGFEVFGHECLACKPDGTWSQSLGSCVRM